MAVFAYMEKKFLVPLTKELESRLVVIAGREAMFGAPSLAGRHHFALPAPARQGHGFGNSETGRQRPVHHSGKPGGHYIPESVLGINAVVTGIDIAVVFDGNRPSACLRVDANR